MARGYFITFEGLDGSGKSTQQRWLGAALRQSGYVVCETRQPGGTDFGYKLRTLLLDARTEKPIAPLTELAMMFADRAQTIAEVIAPALERGELVLCDRWTDSTEAYQGGGRGLGEQVVQTLHTAVCAGLQPDLTILLLPALHVALERARRRNARQTMQTGKDESRFEAEPDAFFERAHAQYKRLAEREAVRVVVIESNDTVEMIHARIVRLVEARLFATRLAGA
jgi:dTMP kinase